MLNRLKRYLLPKVMNYLNSHTALKIFIKNFVQSNRFAQRVAFSLLETKVVEPYKKDVCGKRAQRVYEELKKGIE